jgi:hypothetical protein
MNNLLRHGRKCLIFYLFLCFNLAISPAKSLITEGGKSPIYVLTLAQDSLHFSNIRADTSIDKLLLRRQKHRIRDSIELVSTGKMKNIAKIAPGALILNYALVSYERSIAKRQSLEMKLGIVGLGANSVGYSSEGAYFGLAYKVNLSLYDVPRHKLHGAYLRPEFVVGGYNVRFKNTIYSSGNSVPTTQKENHRINFHVYMVSLGKQYVDNRLTFDYFVSIGKGFYKQSEETLGIVETIRYGNPMSIKNVSGEAFVFKIGFTVGYLF